MHAFICKTFKLEDNLTTKDKNFNSLEVPLYHVHYIICGVLNRSVLNSRTVMHIHATSKTLGNTDIMS